VAEKAATQFAEGPVPPTSSPGIVRVRGRVLLPDGRPAVGATVRAVKYADPGFEGGSESLNVLATFVVDSQGEFQGSVNTGPRHQLGIETRLWATLPSYGLAVHPLADGEKSAPIVMNLGDDEPIRGRILDLEGQPVRDARVEIIKYFDTTTPWVEQWLTS